VHIEKFVAPSSPQRFGRKRRDRRALARAFAEFAGMSLGDKVRKAMVKQFAKPGLVGHINRDAKAIEGREKPVAKVRPSKPAPRKKGRPRRGEVREPKPATRLQRQVGQDAAEALAELPVHCDVGTKKNSKGYKKRNSWVSSINRAMGQGSQSLSGWQTGQKKLLRPAWTRRWMRAPQRQGSPVRP
jgi:hypothetical protein